MSTNRTENYQLHVWEAEDNFLREEFNENFALLDGELGTKCRMMVGTYTGDGTQERSISLGFTPRAVLIMPQDQFMNASYFYLGGLAVEGSTLLHGSSVSAAIVEGGFQVSHFFFSGGNYSTTITCNKKDVVFHYIAFA